MGRSLTMFHIALEPTVEVVRQSVAQTVAHVHTGPYDTRTCSVCAMESVKHHSENDACPMCTTGLTRALRSALARDAFACGIPYMALAVMLEGIQRVLQGDMNFVVVRGDSVCDAYAFAALVASQGDMTGDMLVTSVGTGATASWLPHHCDSVGELRRFWSLDVTDLVVLVMDVRLLAQVYERVRPAYIIVFCTDERHVLLDTQYKLCANVRAKTEYADRFGIAQHTLLLFHLDI